MVGYNNFVITQLLPQLLKPGITQVSGGHLDGNALLCGIFLGFKMLYKALNAIPFGIISDKLFVAIRFLAAQMEIAMRRDKIHLDFQQQIRQNHGIDAAAEGQNDFFALGNQVTPINICLELINHCQCFTTNFPIPFPST